MDETLKWRPSKRADKNQAQLELFQTLKDIQDAHELLEDVDSPVNVSLPFSMSHQLKATVFNLFFEVVGRVYSMW